MKKETEKKEVRRKPSLWIVLMSLSVLCCVVGVVCYMESILNYIDWLQSVYPDIVQVVPGLDGNLYSVGDDLSGVECKGCKGCKDKSEENSDWKRFGIVVICFVTLDIAIMILKEVFGW